MKKKLILLAVGILVVLGWGADGGAGGVRRVEAFAAPGVTAQAESSACLGHAGVECLMGSDTDGSVICKDGWRGSTVLYVTIRDHCGVDYRAPEQNMSEFFLDVARTHPNRDAILYLLGRGIVSGYDDGTFKPENPINRAELLKVLLEGAGVTPDASKFRACFTDVQDEWFARYVCYAKSIGWIDGYPDGWFRPEQYVNKAEAIKMVMNSQHIALPSLLTADPFIDVPRTEWFAPYVQAAVDMDLLEDNGDSLKPGDPMTRGSFSETLYRTIVWSLE